MFLKLPLFEIMPICFIKHQRCTKLENAVCYTDITTISKIHCVFSDIYRVTFKWVALETRAIELKHLNSDSQIIELKEIMF